MEDIILVAEEQDHYKFLEHFSKILKMKADGPYGMTLPGTLFYLKTKLTFDEQGLEIAASSKYVPPHSSLDVFDATVVEEDERLGSEESKRFRSALGLCLYLSQERIDVQRSVRILSDLHGKSYQDSYGCNQEAHNVPADDSRHGAEVREDRRTMQRVWQVEASYK